MYARAHSQSAFHTQHRPSTAPPSLRRADWMLACQSTAAFQHRLPPVIRGAAALASICGAGAAAVTERTSLGVEAGCPFGLFCPKVSGLLAKAFEGPLQTCLCRSNPSFSQGKFGSIPECAFVLCSPTPLTLLPSPSHPSADQQRKSLGPGIAMQQAPMILQD